MSADAEAIINSVLWDETTGKGILSALSTAGWVVVPREPTTDMLQDGQQAGRKARRASVSGMTIDAQVRAECAVEAAIYRAMIAAAHPAAGWVVEQGWQPIETAPMDGTAVLCWPFEYSSMFEGTADPEIVIGFFAEDDWWCESTVAKKFEPTHWRLLPAAPEPRDDGR